MLTSTSRDQRIDQLEADAELQLLSSSFYVCHEYDIDNPEKILTIEKR